jgi:hypothetical protein
MMTRDEHLAWCKRRAREYLDQGDLPNAVTSMLSDLKKHPELKGIGEKMGLLGMNYLMQNDAAAVRRWVEGFR